MLGSTYAEFCTKKLRNREGDLKLAGSPSLYHQSFGLLWTTIIFNCFGWTGSLSQEKHPLVTREDHWIAMLASDAVLAKCLRKTLSCFYVVHSQLLPQWISLNFWKGSGKGRREDWTDQYYQSSFQFYSLLLNKIISCPAHNWIGGYVISFSHQPWSYKYLQTKLAQSKHGINLYPAGQCAVLQGSAGSKHVSGKPRLQCLPKNKQEKQTNKLSNNS